MAIYIKGTKTDSIFIGSEAKEPTPIYTTYFRASNCDQPADVNIADYIKPAPSVTSWANWFENAKFTDLDLRSWDGSNVTNVGAICTSAMRLKSVKLGSFTQCTNFSGMFRSTILTDFSIESATLPDGKTFDINRMFINCMTIEEVDLSPMIGKVTGVAYAFESCTKLRKLDVSNLDFTTCTQSNMFYRSTPTDCLVLVKDQANKDWFTQYCPTMTNVVIK